MKMSFPEIVSGLKQSQRRIEVSCIGLIRLVVCVLFTYVDRLVMKYLSASSSCGDYFTQGASIFSVADTMTS